MKEYSEWLSPQGVDCIHIPIGAYHDPELLEESDIQELLFFTTLAPFKGLELLLKAFEYLRRDYPKLKLTIAGTEHIRFPDYARQLKTRFSKTDGVNWLGQTSEDHIIELFRRAQIVVLPYTASTGSSSVVYQAATWGRAVVASNLKDIKKLAIESDLQVEFFETGNILSLTRAIRNLIESKEERKRQAEHNFNAILRTRPHETSRKYIQAFNRALEKRLSSKRIAMPVPEKKTA
jgi:glycosyltransferase involved in cell wall biosynthesis